MEGQIPQLQGQSLLPTHLPSSPTHPGYRSARKRSRLLRGLSVLSITPQRHLLDAPPPVFWPVLPGKAPLGPGTTVTLFKSPLNIWVRLQSVLLLPLRTLNKPIRAMHQVGERSLTSKPESILLSRQPLSRSSRTRPFRALYGILAPHGIVAPSQTMAASFQALPQIFLHSARPHSSFPIPHCHLMENHSLATIELGARIRRTHTSRPTFNRPPTPMFILTRLERRILR